MFVSFQGCWAQRHCNNVLIADRLASCKLMTVVGHSCAETSGAADEPGIRRWSWVNLVKYATVGVSDTSSLARQRHWSRRTVDSGTMVRHNTTSFGQSRLMAIALQSVWALLRGKVQQLVDHYGVRLALES